MKDLWLRTFELFRRYPILWVPGSVAALLTLALVRLQKAAISGIFKWFMTQHSALGAEVPSADIGKAQAHAWMVAFPLGLCKQYLEVCAFVVAFAMTAKLVGMIIEEERPDLMESLRGIALRRREILLFSLMYMVLNGAVLAAFALFGSFSLTSDRFTELAGSKILLYAVGLVWEACLAWLLLPAAIRLLKAPESSSVTAEGRKLGVVFAVVTSAVALALENLVGRAEARVVLDKQWEATALATINTILVNAPEVVLFIALALLAFGSEWDSGVRAIPEDDTLPTEPVTE